MPEGWAFGYRDAGGVTRMFHGAAAPGPDPDPGPFTVPRTRLRGLAGRSRARTAAELPLVTAGVGGLGGVQTGERQGQRAENAPQTLEGEMHGSANAEALFKNGIAKV